MTQIPIRSFRLEKNGVKRNYGIFLCANCGSEFQSRMERISKMTGNCSPCSRKIAGEKRFVHGMSNKNSRLHITWANMKRRCLSPVGKEKTIYESISVCEEWMDFTNFYSWAMSNGYSEKMTIDRINPKDGYHPSNCRFCDYSTQSANRKITNKNKSGYIGVNFEKGAWVASIQWRKKQNYLGRFKSAADAAEVRDRYIIENGLPHTLSSGINSGAYTDLCL